MKKFILALLLLTTFVVLAQNTIVEQATEIFIRNSVTNAVGLRIIKPTNNVAPFLEFGSQQGAVFSVGSTGEVTATLFTGSGAGLTDLPAGSTPDFNAQFESAGGSTNIVSGVLLTNAVLRGSTTVTNLATDLDANNLQITNLAKLTFTNTESITQVMSQGGTNLLSLRNTDGGTNNGMYFGDNLLHGLLALQIGSVADGQPDPRIALSFGSQIEWRFRERDIENKEGLNILSYDSSTNAHAGFPSQFGYLAADLTCAAHPDFTNSPSLSFTGQSNDVFQFEFYVAVTNRAGGSDVKITSSTGVEWVNYNASLTDSSGATFSSVARDAVNSAIGDSAPDLIFNYRFTGSVRITNSPTIIRAEVAPNSADVVPIIKKGSYVKAVKYFAP